MTNNYLITVILPTYNAGTRGGGIYLREAIESVLKQTYEKFELIIVNDGSTDNTENIVSNYSDHRIKYIYQRNAGQAEARNTGLKHAKGNYICFLDDDDYYESKLEKQLYYLIENNHDVVYKLILD